MDDHQARCVAYEWHGGQGSPLYALASSGFVPDFNALMDEMRDCINTTYKYASYTQTDRSQLERLAKYCRTKLKRSPDMRFQFVAPWASTKE